MHYYAISLLENHHAVRYTSAESRSLKRPRLCSDLSRILLTGFARTSYACPDHGVVYEIYEYGVWTFNFILNAR